MMSTESSAVKHAAAIMGLLGVWFGAGLAGETWGLDAVWWVIYTAAIGLVVLPLTAVLAVGGAARHLRRAVFEGLLAGGLATVLIILGAFSPYAAEWGGRVPENFGGAGESGVWRYMLGILALAAVIGAGIGAVGGLLAWALRGVGRRFSQGH